MAVGGTDNIFIINVLTQQKVNEIKISGSSCITCFCKINDNILLTIALNQLDNGKLMEKI